MHYENVLYSAWTNSFSVVAGASSGGANMSQALLSNIKIISALASYRALDGVTGLAVNDLTMLATISGNTSKNASSRIPGFNNYTANILVTIQGYESLKFDLNLNASAGDTINFNNNIYLKSTSTNNINIQAYWLIGFILID